jgi:zinc transporter ZupT
MIVPDDTEILATLGAVMQTLALVMEKLTAIEAQTAARMRAWERRLALLTWSGIVTFVAVAAYLIGAAC